MRLSKFVRYMFFVFFILTGCWDVVNIEERGFVIGSAIDLADHGASQQIELMMTNQVVVPAGMISPSVESGTGEKAFLNFTSTGNSIFEMMEEVASLSSKVPYYEHLSVLVVSEDVLKEEQLFTKIFDTYIRDVNLRRSIKIVVAKGKAEAILEYTSPNYKLPAIYIDELVEKGSSRVGFLKPIVAGEVEEFHLQNKSYILPYISANNYLEYQAGAVMHGANMQMVGLFNATEMQSIGMIVGEKTLKVIEFIYEGESFALDAIKLINKPDLQYVDKHNINVTFDIEIEGVIKELVQKADLTNSAVIESIQNAVSDHVKKLILHVLHKGQQEFGADVFSIWRLMETKYYKQWKQIEDDWEKGEQIFKNVTFDINVETEIYSTGTTNKTN